MVTPRDPSEFDESFEGRFFEGGGDSGAGSEPELVRRIPEGVQGASEIDLRAFPPDGEICAHFRELLRDRADADRCPSDLAAEVLRRLDAHLHDCRECQLALARADYEIVRLEKAFAPLRAHLPRPSADFTARVLERAFAADDPELDDSEHDDPEHDDRELAADRDPELGFDADAGRERRAHPSDVPAGRDARELGRGDQDESSHEGLPAAPSDFTDRVMEAVRDTLGAEARALGRRPAPGLRGRRRRFATRLVAAALVCSFGFLAAWLWYGSSGGHPSAQVMRVQAAAGATSGNRVLQRGDFVAAQSLVTTSSQGFCVLEVFRADVAEDGQGGDALAGPARSGAALAGNGTAALVELGPDAMLRAERGTIAPLRGESLVRVASELRVVLDASEARLQAGEFVVAATPIERLDQALSSAPFRRFRIECRHGAAGIRRHAGDPRSTMLPAGFVARFDAWSPLVLEPDPSSIVARLRASSGSTIPDLRTGEPEAKHGGIFVGSVVDRVLGKPIPGATVRLHLPSQDQVLVSDARGEFRIPNASSLAGTFAMVEVLPPQGSASPRYAAFGPAPLRLEGIGPGRESAEELLREVALSEGSVARGRVRDAEGRWLAGARLQAYRHDELVGSLVPIPGASGVSDAEGAFLLHGLPSELPVHTACVVLAESSTSAPVAAWPRLDGSPCELVVTPGQEARVLGLAPDLYVEIAEGAAGLPLTAIERRVRARADREGVARIPGVGTGPLWLQKEAHGPWFELLATREADGIVLRVGERELAASIAKVLDSRARDAGSANGPASAAVARLARSVDRYSGRPVAPNAASVKLAGGVALPPRGVHVTDGEGGSLSLGTQLFVVSSDGERWSFLGEYDGRRAIPLRGEFEAGSRLVGIGRDGSLCSSSLDRLPENPSLDLTMQVRRTGGLELAPQLRPAPESGRQALHLSLRMLGGEYAGLTFSRCAEAASEWVVDGIPAGEYEVVLDDGRRAFTTIEPRMRARLAIDAVTPGATRTHQTTPGRVPDGDPEKR